MSVIIMYLMLISSIVFLSAGIQDPMLKASIERGRDVYNDFCVTCHLGNGDGTKGIIPPLAKSDYLLNKRIESIRAVKYGQQGKIKVNGVEYNGIMANQQLTDEEVADVMNYILNSWGNKGKKTVTVEEVRSVKKSD
jgi:mono/diheme cytochrome c family protein